MSASIGAAETASGADPIRAAYVEDGGSLFWLALRTALLSVITLGLYRFWMTVRLRRHYWSSVRIMGDPFEYTGTGLEKLLGFLVAVVILAIYLGAVNLGLAFIGLMNIDDPVMLQLAFNLSLLATVPLIYFAIYRARRYLMARTRWRGIRFGMDPGAFGYMKYALGYGLLTLLSLGVLYPYQHFKLTKYKIDRTWFGDQRFVQEGRWQGLLGAWLWVYVLGVLIAGSGVFLALNPDSPVAAAAFAMIFGFGYLGLLVLMVRYNVVAFRYFWAHRRLGEARFHNDVDLGEVIGVTIAGTMAAATLAFFAAFALFLIMMGIWLGVVGLDRMVEIFQMIEASNGQSLGEAWPLLVGMAVLYLLVFALSFAFSQILVRRPILRRQVAGMQIAGAAALARTAQRPHDDAVEAGGFADALGVDVGAGF